MSSKSNRTVFSCRSSKDIAHFASLTLMDAKLHADFETSEQPFSHSASINASNRLNGGSSMVSTYLHQLQEGKLIQPFGCLVAVEDQMFTIIAYSENTPEMLDLTQNAVTDSEHCEFLTIGADIQILFQSPSAAALQKAASFEEVHLLNPILVHCRNSGKPFYAIMHRIDVGLVIDLEPVDPASSPVTAAGALESYKLATKAISRLQSLPSGDLPLLCDALVREVSELTGYDRVMAYKFHKDEHGEVIAECKRSDLEPYLGFHYPATDIPQASRFLFLRNKVRMIGDCGAPPVEVIQDKKLAQPLSLCGSTLRAPDGCHVQYMANMGSVASLVFSITTNDDETGSDQLQKGRTLWGLVVCHHTSPRFIPFPLRHACDFLVQVFGIQLNKEVELAAQIREKQILRTRTVLCDMLLLDNPVGIITRSPNVMDLVKCDGAALFYKNQLWLLETTPTEAQIRDIADWLLEYHDGTMGFTTDSLIEAGYPGASALGDVVCGMAAIRITSKDFIFWFRSNLTKEIKWGGAKHDPLDRDDNGNKMQPQSSFKAFVEVVKQRSLLWEDIEMDAIHSLQLILRGSLDDSKITVKTPLDDGKRIQGIDHLRTVAKEMVHLIETAIVPIWQVDASGNMKRWNAKAVELTGLSEKDALGLPLINIVEDDSVEAVKKMLCLALQGKEERSVEIKLKTFGRHECKRIVILVVNVCCLHDLKDDVVGVCFVAQDVTGKKLAMDRYARIQGDYIATVRNPRLLIPPIFVIDEYGCCFEWNAPMQKLSCLKRDDAINNLLVGEVFSLHGFGCRVKDQDMLIRLGVFLNNVLAGQDADELLFGFFDKKGNYVEALLSANKRTNSEGRITGALCFLHVASPELQHALMVQRMSEKASMNSLKELTYIRQEIKNSLYGIEFTHKLMEASNLTQKQKQLLRTSAMCQDQLKMIIDDKELESIEQCSYMEMNMEEFKLGESLKAVVTQGMILSEERKVPLVHDLPSDVCSLLLYGDNLRLQQVLADFLLIALQFTPPSEGSVLLLASPRKEQIGTRLQSVHLEFRIIHPAPGIPEALVRQMFHHSKGISREGLGLYISRKLVKLMNGTVQYLRDEERSSFIINIVFPLAHMLKGFDTMRGSLQHG